MSVCLRVNPSLLRKCTRFVFPLSEVPEPLQLFCVTPQRTPRSFKEGRRWACPENKRPRLIGPQSPISAPFRSKTWASTFLNFEASIYILPDFSNSIRNQPGYSMFLRKILLIAPFVYIQPTVFSFIRLILLYLFMEIYYIVYNIHTRIEYMLKCTYTENVYINHLTNERRTSHINHINEELGSLENK